MINVELTAEELKFVSHVGQQRHDENVGVANIASYGNRKYPLTGLQAHKLGVLGEAAVGKFLGYNIMDVPLDVWASFIPKSEYKKNREQPDWPGVEVRRCNKVDAPLPIRAKDLQDGLRLIHVYCPFTQATFQGPIKVERNVQLLGWAHSQDYYEGTTPWWSKNGDRVVTRRPMEEWV